MRHDLELLDRYGSEPRQSEVVLGVDGALGNAWDGVFVAFDVPLAAIADTLALPVTASLDPPPVRPVALGCGWAQASAPAPEGARAVPARRGARGFAPPSQTSR